jgi:hypothetical protein
MALRTRRGLWLAALVPVVLLASAVCPCLVASGGARVAVVDSDDGCAHCAPAETDCPACPRCSDGGAVCAATPTAAAPAAPRTALAYFAPLPDAAVPSPSAHRTPPTVALATSSPSALLRTVVLLI